MNTISTLVFDWGNTLMRVFPDQTGPMFAWSKIAAVESAHEMLSSIHGKYQLILATNAADSTAVQVQKALENQGLLRLSCGHIMVGFAASGVCVPARISVLHRPGRQRNNMPGWL